MENKTCENCKYFRQHYSKLGKRYIETVYGHCVYPRLKRRETDSPACEHHQAKKSAPGGCPAQG